MVAAVDKVVAEVASHKAGTARNKHAILLHARLGLDRRALILRALRLLQAKIKSTQRFARDTRPHIYRIPPSSITDPLPRPGQIGPWHGPPSRPEARPSVLTLGFPSTCLDIASTTCTAGASLALPDAERAPGHERQSRRRAEA